MSDSDVHPPSTDAEEGFLHRWSRRKQQQPEPAEPIQTAQANQQTEATAQAQPNDDDMPPLESLSEDSDYSGFLSPNVSDELRKLALRKLFHSACFNVCDGLDDYDEDFSSFAKLGDIVTAEMRHRLEQEARKLAETQSAASETTLSEANAEDPDVAENELLSDPTQLADAAAQPEQSEDKA